jgi:ribokinase
MKTSSAKKKIAVVGSANTDMVIRLARIPRPGETVLGGDFLMAAGGKGANQAVAASRAGGDITFIARVGDDQFGRQAVAGFVRDRIRIKYIIRDQKAPSGVALIFVAPDGENSIAVASGANANLSVPDIRRARSVIAEADVLLMQLETPMKTVQEAARIASEAAVPVVLNPAPAQPLNDELLHHITVLTPNETEAELLSRIRIAGRSDLRRAADRLLGKGVKAVLITLGAKGVYVAEGKKRDFVPSFKVKPVDTTAAGDAFNGALAVALAERRPLLQAVRFACAAAALSTTRYGAQPSLPTRRKIEKILVCK